MIRQLKKLIDFILPQRCLLCGKVISSPDSLCLDCFDKISFITTPYCSRCGKPLMMEEKVHDFYCASCLKKKRSFRLCRSAIYYDDLSKKLLLDFKFADHIENRKLLSKWLYIAGKDIFDAGVDLIIPVPLHYTRLLKRKYNQSAMLAAELSKLIDVPVNYKVLKKIRYTLPQVHCNGQQRKKNIKDAFSITDNTQIKGKRIVIIDDVYTTGSTLKECTAVLKKSGAKSVDLLTVARVCS